MSLNQVVIDESRDINDVFDNILLAEECVSREGYSEGFKVGLVEGEKEGYHLGYHRGAQIGAQIGYFKGIVGVLLKHKRVGEGKSYQNIVKMKTLLDDFPTENSENVDLLSALETIKGLYKIICTQLKINPSLPGSQIGLIIMSTVELLQSNIARTLTFLDPFWPLISSHMVTFITDSLYYKYLPVKFRDNINEMGCTNVMNMLFQHCNSEKVEEDRYIGRFLNEIRQIHCDNRKVDFYTFSDFRNLLHSEGCKDLSIIRMNGFMTEKKCHEVSLMSVLVAELAYFTNSQLIVDVGDGKGYLSSFLALEYSLKVLGLDSSSIKTQGAAKRNLKLSKVWSGTRKKCKGENNEILLKTELQSNEKSDYKQTTEFISDSTDIANVILREFDESFSEIGLVGLHTCGDLAPVCLRQFVKDPNQKFVVNIGCCYHLLTEGCSQSSGFPQSKYLRDRSFHLGRNARMISLKPKWKIGSEKSVPNESLLYRAILQQIIEDKKGLKMPENIQVGRIAAKCSSFPQYVRMAFNKLSLDIQMSDTEINEYFQKYSLVRSQLWIYFMMFCCLSSLIEDIILQDRLLYLKEQGFDKSYIVEMFDPVVSPRCHGIIAFR